MNEKTRTTLLFLVLAGGFATMAVEIRYLHRDVLGEEWQAAIPVVFSATAFVACVMALSPARWLRTVVAAVMACGVFFGGYGTLLHSNGEPAAFQRLITAAIVARADDDDDSERGSESEPPVLAPLGIAGLSMVGFLLALPGRKHKPQ